MLFHLRFQFFSGTAVVEVKQLVLATVLLLEMANMGSESYELCLKISLIQGLVLLPVHGLELLVGVVFLLDEL